MKKRLTIIFVILFIFLGLGASTYFLFYQPKEKVVDETQESTSDTDYSANGNSDSEDIAVLSSQVHTYMGADAETVNEAIQSVEYVNSELVLRFSEDTSVELATLGIDELFWLDGNENTPLGDTYIGKVVSNIKENGEIVLSIESPMLDEVFDEVYFDDEFEITTENINSISTIEGVEITPVSAIPTDFMETNFTGSETEQIDLIYNNEVQSRNNNTAEVQCGNFVISVDVDFKNLLGIKKKPGSDLKEDSEDEKLIKGDTKCKITGKIGVEDLAIHGKIDWKKQQYGLKEFSLGVSGKQVAHIALDFSLEGEVSGATTNREIGNQLKLKGLKEKVFPIAYFDCTPKKIVKLTAYGIDANKQIKKHYELTPFSCGFMLYMDIYGNLSIGIKGNMDYSDEFDNTWIMIENNQFINKFEGKSNPQRYFSVDIGAHGDADIHIGASALLYLFNINVADVAIMKFGAEVEGKGHFVATTANEEDEGFNGNFYARLYLKVIDVKAAIKTQVKLWKIKEAVSFEYENILFDFTLAETGQKKDIHYNPDTMRWSKMTAEDADYIYYKGINGKLLREKKSGSKQKIVIYENEFFSICGLDQSYLYILEPMEEQTYNVRKINKDGTTDKVIIEDVKYVFMFKDDDIYYVPAFSSKQIYKMNRSTLKEEKMCEFDYNVEYMNEENGMFFVVTREESLFSWLWGSSCNYYRISYEGEIQQEYGANILPQDCLKYMFSDYIVASRLVSNGYLRVTATEVYWLSKDMQTSVETEGVSGWNPTDKGIFTERSGVDGKYEIILYQAENGENKAITTVSSSTSFFTLVQDRKGKWYFMDQTDTDLELYQMDEQLQRKKLLAKISLNEIPCDMNNCSMEMINNKIIFYTMPDWSKSEVIYRYDLY